MKAKNLEYLMLIKLSSIEAPVENRAAIFIISIHIEGISAIMAKKSTN